ncbi:MAG: hypothetical protein LBK83_01805 [Treponema sp.]|jgi:hypothetical protein|nr:hypothetical protein [Treponema sp.]
MKKKIFLVLAVTVFLVSCGTSLPSRYSIRSWPGSNYVKGRVKLREITVDRTGGTSSLEEEARGLVFMYLREKGYSPVGEDEDGDYLVDMILREREYISGWKTKRSIAADLCFRPGSISAASPAGALMPVSASRVVCTGEESLASSKTLGKIIRLAVGRGIRSLEKNR